MDPTADGISCCKPHIMYMDMVGNKMGPTSKR